ncbi:MAG: ornithine--oxo-acid transaminase [Candidatus Eisenbacteria bacterium]|uniref:ornithine aminotransferase n=1 Tax=Eiseniibacteriota bacterium TaxID=2212470 RepID=A0A956N9Z7_UNCEI|nr:ornithine--oxo-acid transaminase [Candidatus Eisenbacteria bacterium]MCB9463277.1 ornithine--oxo-acid transaminase [Candidatus Eisenbacteria bacterium]
MQNSSESIMHLAETVGAHNYHPLPVVISKAEGVWVWDPEGRKYMDFLSAYSAVNQGHRHPKIIQALKDQADRVTLTSRAFHNDRMGDFLKKLSDYTGFDMVLPMNTGAEAVETAIKMARMWGSKVKGVPNGKQEIITVAENFHGRTTTIISFSTDPEAKDHYGPYTPGFVTIPYDDPAALEAAINENTVAFLFEPIQGEAGVYVPSEGYLKKTYDICKKHNVLYIADEVQTGFCRTGKKFAVDHEGIRPDAMCLGKALGGGVFPVSAVVANHDVLGVFTPGTHGSTFGGNPLGAAVALAALEVLEDENLAERSHELGEYLRGELRKIQQPKIKQVRGKGLLNAVVFEDDFQAWDVCVALKEKGLLAKQTHGNIIRFAPPLVISKDEVDHALAVIKSVFEAIA